jgi:hypothetical protein
VLAGFLVLALATCAIVFASRYSRTRSAETSSAQSRGLSQHQRAGNYPSTCTWCKNTALAKKLIVYQRSENNWRPFDMMERLRTCLEHEVSGLASIYMTGSAQFRRLCTERCAMEFLSAERVQNVDPYDPCTYCSTKYPLALFRCPNCGAGRQAA